MQGILTDENVEYDKAAVAEVIKKYLPDWRRVLNELQRYSGTGRIDSGILANLGQVLIKTLVGFLKDRNFTEMRKWAAENIDNDVNPIFRMLYDTLANHVDKASLPAIVLIIAKYQYQSSFVADQEINLAACLTEIMMEASFV